MTLRLFLEKKNILSWVNILNTLKFLFFRFLKILFLIDLLVQSLNFNENISIGNLEFFLHL